MKVLIEKIEAKKQTAATPHGMVDVVKLKDVQALLQSLPEPIRAKALMWRGKFITWNQEMGAFVPTDLPEPLNQNETIEHTKECMGDDLPNDEIIMVDLEIRVIEPNL
jgi:hypothetical protein